MYLTHRNNYSFNLARNSQMSCLFPEECVRVSTGEIKLAKSSCSNSSFPISDSLGGGTSVVKSHLGLINGFNFSALAFAFH